MRLDLAVKSSLGINKPFGGQTQRESNIKGIKARESHSLQMSSGPYKSSSYMDSDWPDIDPVMVCFLSSVEDNLSAVYEYFNKVRRQRALNDPNAFTY